MWVLMYRCCLDAIKQLHCILSVTLGRKEQQELTTPSGVRQLDPLGCCCRRHEGVPDPSTPGEDTKFTFTKMTPMHSVSLKTYQSWYLLTWKHDKNTISSFWKWVKPQLQGKYITKNTNGYFWWYGFKTLGLAIKALRAKLMNSNFYLKKEENILLYEN